MPLDDLIKARIHERGPMTVAAFMDLALYHPGDGYYARAAQRSGRAGDFFTSVDVGPLFGELLATQIAEMAAILSGGDQSAAPFDLVEAGAGNGRLSADILRHLARCHPSIYERTRLHLVEASASARDAQRLTLAETAERLGSSSDQLPTSFSGVLIANELLDAMPVHQVVMRDALREVYVDVADGALVRREGPPSTPRLAEYLHNIGVTLEPGWRIEIGLAAVDWLRDAIARLTRGFFVIIDYGHEARELYSVSHSAGTLTSYSGHRAAGADQPQSTVAWMKNPGEQDLTAHVDFTSLRRAADRAGATTLGFLDQMYFLMALGTDRFETMTLKDRLALKTLVMPGGLGSTMKVWVLGKGVGQPVVKGCSGRVRAT